MLALNAELISFLLNACLRCAISRVAGPSHRITVSLSETSVIWVWLLFATPSVPEYLLILSVRLPLPHGLFLGCSGLANQSAIAGEHLYDHTGSWRRGGHYHSGEMVSRIRMLATRRTGVLYSIYCYLRNTRLPSCTMSRDAAGVRTWELEGRAS